MIDRYLLPELAEFFDPQVLLADWRLIEVAIAGAQAHHGIIPDVAYEAIRDAGTPTPERIAIEERRTRHEVEAFVRVLATGAGEYGDYVHLGATSSDVTDSALFLRLARASHVLNDLLAELRTELEEAGERWSHTQRVGRTHGRPAEPVPLGAQFDRWSELLFTTLAPPLVKLSGATGSHLTNSRAIEAEFARRLGGELVSHTTQIIPREHLMPWLSELIQNVGICEQVARFVRLGAVVDEVAEEFGPQQVGSTAMPHKRNPIRSEQICGLAGVIRGRYSTLLQCWAGLWWERDLTNSSVERIDLWDLVALTGWLYDSTAKVLRGLSVDLEALARGVAALGIPSSVRLYDRILSGQRRLDVQFDIATSPGVAW